MQLCHSCLLSKLVFLITWQISLIWNCLFHVCHLYIVNFRKLKSINPSDFAGYVVPSLSDLQSAPLEDKILQLNTVLASNLDSFAPLTSRSVSFARSALWYNDDLRSKKAACRKLERMWLDSGLTVFYQSWNDHLGEYRAEIESARSFYFSQIIDSNQSNPIYLSHYKQTSQS